MSGLNGNNDISPNSIELVLTDEELIELAEGQARDLLGTSLEEVFAKLDRGELHGSIAEAEFSMLREMIDA